MNIPTSFEVDDACSEHVFQGLNGTLALTISKDFAQNVKNQSKPDNIGSPHQKPNQRAFFASNQAMKPKSQKIQNSGSILANYQKSNQRNKGNQKFKD
nr:hypothetical protein [Tanacetum cinerariifolium]